MKHAEPSKAPTGVPRVPPVTRGLHRNVAAFERQLLTVKTHASSRWHQEIQSRCRPRTAQSAATSTIMQPADVASGWLNRRPWPMEERTVQMRVAMAQARPATRGLFDAAGTPERYGRSPCHGEELLPRCRGVPSRRLKSTLACIGRGGVVGGGGYGGEYSSSSCGGDGGGSEATVDCSFSGCKDLEAVLHIQIHLSRKIRANKIAANSGKSAGGSSGVVVASPSLSAPHSQASFGSMTGHAPPPASAAAPASSLASSCTSRTRTGAPTSLVSSSRSTLPLPSKSGVLTQRRVTTLRLANNDLRSLDDAGAWFSALLHAHAKTTLDGGGSVLGGVAFGADAHLSDGDGSDDGHGHDEGAGDGGGAALAFKEDPVETLLADALRRHNRRIVEGAALDLAHEAPLVWGGGLRAGRSREKLLTQSTAALACVQILDLSCNFLEGEAGKPGGALAPLASAGLDGVCSLLLHSNRLTRLEDVEVLRALPRLRALTLHSNPLCQAKHYRTRVIALLPQLAKLDTAPVTPADREKAATWLKLNVQARQNRKATRKNRTFISPWGTV